MSNLIRYFQATAAPTDRIGRGKYLPAGIGRTAVCAVQLSLAIFLTLPATCQTQPEVEWKIFNAGGGWTKPVGTERKNLDAGWKNLQAGAGFQMKGGFFLNFNFLFDELDVKAAALQQARTLNPTNVGLLQATSGKAKYYAVTFEPMYRAPLPGERVNGYVFAGFGWFRRNLEFTGNGGQGALLQPGSPTVFGSGGNSGAVDAGGGIDFKPSAARLKLYLEARVVHGLAINHETTLVPVSIGIRW